MTIETLIEALPPPAAPTYAFDGSWEPLEAKIGTQLPQDYKDLLRLYGSGAFMEYFGIYSPICPAVGGQLLPEIYRVQRYFVEDTPHRMYPQPGGLLVCGSTDNGEYIFWLTRGPVSEWPIVVWDHDCAEDEALEIFECGLTDFLAGLITGDIRPRAFPKDMSLQEGEQAFRPSADPWPEYSSPG